MESLNEIFSKISDFFKVYGFNILAAILILIIGYFLIKLLCKGLMKIIYATKLDNAVGGFIVAVLRVVLWIILAFLIVSILGLSGNSFLVAFSSVALAVGMALKDSIANIANGIIIIMTKPFKKGDHISVGGVEGIVKTIKVLTTEIYTFDNKKVIIPNATIVNNSLTNYTANPTRRIDLIIGVSYESDVALVKKVLYGILAKNEMVLDVPKPIVLLKEFNASSIDFLIKYWTKTENYYTVLGVINEQILAEFRENNIEIPYTKVDVQIKEIAGDKKWN